MYTINLKVTDANGAEVFAADFENIDKDRLFLADHATPGLFLVVRELVCQEATLSGGTPHMT